MEILDLQYIKSIIQQVLDSRFPMGRRRQIKTTDGKEFNFACPICGDSAKDENKKRGHLYFNTMRYRCYNDGCRSTFTSLAKKYDIALDPDKKSAIIKYIDDNIAYRSQNETDYVAETLDKLIPIEELQAYFDSGGFLQSFRPCRVGDAVYNYMRSRGLPAKFIEDNIYSAIRVITDRWKEPVAVFLNRTKDTVLGMQIRNLKEGKKREYKIYNFEYLYNHVHDTEMDETEAVHYNKLSYLFNILNVSFEEPVTVFEGYVDSLFFPNSIGAVGTNTDFNFLMGNELPIRFFFDNDATGNIKSLEYLTKGFPVFLWQKLLDFCAKKKGDYNENIIVLETIKDLNQFALSAPNPYVKFNLDKYFSHDIFDKIWIPKLKTTKRIKESDTKIKIDTQQWEILKTSILHGIHSN